MWCPSLFEIAYIPVLYCIVLPQKCDIGCMLPLYFQSCSLSTPETANAIRHLHPIVPGMSICHRKQRRFPKRKTTHGTSSGRSIFVEPCRSCCGAAEPLTAHRSITEHVHIAISHEYNLLRKLNGNSIRQYQSTWTGKSLSFDCLLWEKQSISLCVDSFAVSSCDLIMPQSNVTQQQGITCIVTSCHTIMQIQSMSNFV